MTNDISLVGWEWNMYVSGLGSLSEEKERFLWLGVVLRRYSEKSPGGLAQFRPVSSWIQIIEWQLRQNESMPEYMDLYVSTYLRAGNNRPGSENPWSITHRSAPRMTKRQRPDDPRSSYLIAEYAIERVRTLEEDIAFLQLNRSTWQPQAKFDL
jgi:hypothetical protein